MSPVTVALAVRVIEPVIGEKDCRLLKTIALPDGLLIAPLVVIRMSPMPWPWNSST
jgi:hypothetical protein